MGMTEEPVSNADSAIVAVLGYDTVLTQPLLQWLTKNGKNPFFIGFDEAEEKLGEIDVVEYADQFRRRNCSGIINLLSLTRFENKPIDSKLAALTTMCAQHALHTGCKYIHVTDSVCYSGTALPKDRQAFEPYDPLVPCANNDRSRLAVTLEHAALLFQQMPNVATRPIHILRMGPIIPTVRQGFDARQCNSNAGHMIKLAATDKSVRFFMPNKHALISPITDNYAAAAISTALTTNVPYGVYNIGCDTPISIAKFFANLEFAAGIQLTAHSMADATNRSLMTLEDHRFSQPLSPTAWSLATKLKITYNDVVNECRRMFDDAMQPSDE